MRAVRTAAEAADQPVVNWMSLAVATLGGLAGWFVGLWSGVALPFQFLAIAVALDFLSGTYAAWREDKWTARECGDGIVRKLFGLALVLVIERYAPVYGIALPVSGFAAAAWGSVEFASFVRNYERLGGGFGPLKTIIDQIARRGGQG